MFLFNYYYIILGIQGFCLYHAYRRNADQKWYWFIIFFSIIGCAFYLFDAFYKKDAVVAVGEGLKNVVYSKQRLQKLEKEAKYTDSIQNKTNLADAYVNHNRYKEAIDLYESCLNGFNASDPAILSKLVVANYLDENYKQAVYYGDLLVSDKPFSESEDKIAYAWSQYKLGQTELAKQSFESMDHRYSNYPQRLEYIEFLFENDQAEDAQNKINLLLDRI